MTEENPATPTKPRNPYHVTKKDVALAERLVAVFTAILAFVGLGAWHYDHNTSAVCFGLNASSKSSLTSSIVVSGV